MDRHKRSFEEKTEVVQSSSCSLEVHQTSQPQHWKKQKNRNAQKQAKEKDEDNLKKLQEMYNETKPYECLQCEKKFCYQRGLIRHEQQQHKTMGAFKCHQCGKDFCAKTDLDRHNIIHNHYKPKPFKCLQCGKDFCSKRSLVTHKRRHTGEKPFKCFNWGRDFSAKNSLRSHEVRMHCNKQEETDAQPGYLMSVLLELKSILTCTQEISTDSSSHYLQLLEKMTIWWQSGYNVVMGTYLESQSILAVNGQYQLNVQFTKIGDKVGWKLQLDSSVGGASWLVAKGSSSNFYGPLVTCLERFLTWEQGELIKVEVDMSDVVGPACGNSD